ncbi:hypothetical protein ABIE44_002797 [Marmoricola sp. OAE513]|uniref:hypothetical protein n=1 Tax=Marmoricola sp. OAE513 TaxID=2817894 RepID=UPI001AE35850
MTQRRPPRHQSPVRTTADLTALWRSVIGGEPLLFRSLWLLFLDDARRPVGPLLTLDNLPDGPYGIDRDDLVGWCDEILRGPGGGGSVALLLTRPEGAPWTVSDRAWGRFLLNATAEIDGHAWPVHWAHRGGVEVFRLADRGTRTA